MIKYIPIMVRASPIIITLWYSNSLLLNMAIEIVDFSITNGYFPYLC